LDFHFGGSITGAPNVGDVLGVACALNASITGGTLSYDGLTFSTSWGLNADDTASPPILTGSSIDVLDDVTSGPAGALPSGGSWGLDVYLNWTGYGENDTFNVTVPSGSIDIGDTSSVPEPGSGSLLVLPALACLNRRKRRKAASG
jgi:hypothetical protein